MSKARRKAEKMEAGAAQLESALERTQKALEAAEKVEAAGGKRRSGRFFKFVLLATLVGVAIVMVRKAMGGGAGSSGYQPVSSSGTGSTGTSNSSTGANGDSPSAGSSSDEGSSSEEVDEPTA